MEGRAAPRKGTLGLKNERYMSYIGGDGGVLVETCCLRRGNVISGEIPSLRRHFVVRSPPQWMYGRRVVACEFFRLRPGLVPGGWIGLRGPDR